MGAAPDQPLHRDRPPRVVTASRQPGGGIDAAVPALLHAPVRIGSVTKSLTAALALLLDADGTLPLDAPCADALGCSTPLLDAIDWRAVLTHTARLPLEAAPELWRVDCVPPTADELLRAAREAAPLPLPPGTWHYSNFGYGLYAVALERASGRPWQQQLSERLLDPLGMRATTAAPPLDAVPGRRQVEGEWRRAPLISLGACAAAGELWSTFADLLTWGGCLTGGRPDLLPPRLLRELTRPRALAPGGDAVQALGLQTRTIAGRRRLHAAGAMPGYSCALSLLPDGAAVAAWSADGAPLSEVEQAVGEQTAWLEEPAAALSPAAERIAGRWWLDGQPVELELRGGRAVARLADGTALAPLFSGTATGSDSGITIATDAGTRVALGKGGELRWGATTLTRAIDGSATAPAAAARPPRGA